ncbi:GtrA family protein [Mycobacterium seoulense]|uniref:GtrA family protein n=1 Tax=Mycobacterium seoulense TaxID=386911 RepID=UPI003CFB1032
MVHAQFIRYVLVGLGLNATLYAAYLLLTSSMMGSETAMTITFSVGMLLSFLANRNITFRHRGHQLGALGRYLGCYAILYLINFSALWVFTGRLGVPHQAVQGCAILVLALFAFIMQKYWVFPATACNATRITKRST